MKSAPLKLISGTSVELSAGVITYLHLGCLHEKVMLLHNPHSSSGALMTILTSNQVGLPAELKHINKRRKRN
jgi:hypothetical protein